MWRLILQYFPQYRILVIQKKNHKRLFSFITLVEDLMDLFQKTEPYNRYTMRLMYWQSFGKYPQNKTE